MAGGFEVLRQVLAKQRRQLGYALRGSEDARFYFIAHAETAILDSELSAARLTGTG